MERSVGIFKLFVKRSWTKGSVLNNFKATGFVSGQIGVRTTHESPSSASNEPWSENDYVNPKIENRNPRNLEKMCVALKPKGFKLDSPTTHYYHKLMLERTANHTTAYVQHMSGTDVVFASTKEWAIRKHLYSGSDVSSAKNIGRIIAQRCLESGILHVHANFDQEEKNSDAVSEFLKAVEEGGLSLEEPRRIYPLRPWD